MDRIWLSLALVAFGWGAAVYVVTAALAPAALPFGLALLLLICASHAPSRDQVLGVAEEVFSKNALMAVATILLAASLVQFLPLEGALLMAGEVLVYLDAMVAVSLLTASAYSKQIKRRLRGALRRAVQPRKSVRRIGTARRPRPGRRLKAPPKDERPEPRYGEAWATA